MYKNIYYERERKLIHLWDDVEGYTNIKYIPKCWVEVPYETPYKSMYGHNVIEKPISEVTQYDKTFEKDMNTEIKFLVERYNDSLKAFAENLKICYLDIEVDSVGGYAKKGAYDKEIISIAVDFNDESILWLLDKDSRLKKHPENTKVLIYKKEHDLLIDFVDWFHKAGIDILTGWYTELFDVPYIVNRCKKVIKDEVLKLSPINKIISETVGESVKYKIVGVNHLDYIQLYKKFTPNEKNNYKLDNIARIELKKTKTSYKGKLSELYETDIDLFAEYNVNDVYLVKEFEKKLHYIQIAVGIAHKGFIPYEEVFMTSRVHDGAILSFLRKQNIIAPNKPKSYAKENDEEATSAEGAYVKDPKRGIYRWLIDIDATSMYPNNIRSINISPETKVGRIEDWRDYKLEKYVDWKIGNSPIDNVFLQIYDKQFEVDFLQLEEIFTDMNLCVACNGIVYSQEKRGVIPSILDIWFKERKEYQALADKYNSEGNKQLTQEYDIKQYVTKILLNSMYGALLLPSFRYYDKDNGEAVTVTGQTFIKYSEIYINKFLNFVQYSDDFFDMSDFKPIPFKQDYVVAGDTDSNFIWVDNFIDKNEDPIPQILNLANELQSFINEKLETFARVYNLIPTKYEHFFNMKQEMIADSGIFVEKKRYALHIVNKKGRVKDELEVKGIDIIRSNFPEYFRTEMESIVIRMLKFETNNEINKTIKVLKTEMKNQPIDMIGMPTGVKDLTKYIDPNSMYKKGAPVHVKAAINYNFLLKKWGLDTKNEPIYDGDKIKYFYLKNNEYGFDTMAFKQDDTPEEILIFIKKYVYYDKIFTSVLENKLQKFYDVLGWSLNEYEENSYF